MQFGTVAGHAALKALDLPGTDDLCQAKIGKLQLPGSQIGSANSGDATAVNGQSSSVLTERLSSHQSQRHLRSASRLFSDVMCLPVCVYPLPALAQLCSSLGSHQCGRQVACRSLSERREPVGTLLRMANIVRPVKMSRPKLALQRTRYLAHLKRGEMPYPRGLVFHSP